MFDEVEGLAGVLLELHRGEIVRSWLSDISPEFGTTVLPGFRSTWAHRGR
jgi:hypothetical protein